MPPDTSTKPSACLVRLLWSVLKVLMSPTTANRLLAALVGPLMVVSVSLSSNASGAVSCVGQVGSMDVAFAYPDSTGARLTTLACALSRNFLVSLKPARTARNASLRETGPPWVERNIFITTRAFPKTARLKPKSHAKSTGCDWSVLTSGGFRAFRKLVLPATVDLCLLRTASVGTSSIAKLSLKATFQRFRAQGENLISCAPA
mmetsp:Transcript_44451/g.122988  ORF Transcript_44451/g.122988 Transcript_44451/m.122988 type:complete len:204 (+) Transcript_44451:702-1313(+)